MVTSAVLVIRRVRRSMVERSFAVVMVIAGRLQDMKGPRFTAIIGAVLMGGGFLLAGKSDAGKSTAFDRLPDDWTGHCDDEVLIARKKNGGFRVHPMPTLSHHLFEREQKRSYHIENSVPLDAVFFLEKRAPEKIVPLEKHIVAMSLYESAIQTYQRFIYLAPPEFAIKIKRVLYDNACDIALLTKGFKLSHSLTGSYWDLILAEKI